MGPSLEIRYKRYLRALFPDFHQSLADKISPALEQQPLSVLQHDYVFQRCVEGNNQDGEFFLEPQK